MKTAAIYARVSSDKQKEEKTIMSQTEALKEFAKTKKYNVPNEWIFQDNGYSGTNLVRPGLERIRDLAAEGHIQAVLAYSPDRLSRKYAYQVLLSEEFMRYGVEVIFIQAPQSKTPEDKLLLQFQGMIAEYEHAQILERFRRGKLHKAKQGQVNVLSGAPYGYQYIRKTNETPAYYEIIESEAQVIRMIFEWYTTGGFCLKKICEKLNELKIPTKKNKPTWTPSCVRKKLSNPAYMGKACFGKSRTIYAESKKSRRSRLKGELIASHTIMQPSPREAWVEISVPALISEETFGMAQEFLIQNKKLALRKTIEPSILQGLVHCHHCAYSLYRTRCKNKTRTLYYYRCLGADPWRHEGKKICDQKPIRLDLVEGIVWAEIMRLIEDPTLIQNEINRRLETAKNLNPAKQQQKTLTAESHKTQKSMDRLLTAYQEDLLSLDEFRSRISTLRQEEKRIKIELQSLTDQVENHATYLQLAETLSGFLARLKANASNLDVLEQQRIVKLLVRDVAIGHDKIIIRHSISTMQTRCGGAQEGVSGGLGQLDHGQPSSGNYVLCTHRAHRILKTCNTCKSALG